MSFFQNPDNPGRKLPNLLDYEKLVPPLPTTRNNSLSSCSCSICAIVRMKNQEYLKYLSEHSNKVGRPSEGEISPPPKKLKICEKCFSEIAPGKSHNCLKTTKRANMINIVRNSSVKTKCNVIASELKCLAEDQGVSTKGGDIELQSGSKTLPVQIGTKKCGPKEPKFSHENLKNLGARLNLSGNAVM